MIGLALGCEIAERSLFHRKNYFYPDLAEGLPDLPVRRAPVPRRPAGRRAHPPGPPRGGRGQARPPRRERPDPRLGPQLGRLQPRRHAAGRDRHRARHPLGRAGARVADPAARRRCASSASRTSTWTEGSLRCDANVSVRPGRLDRARDQDRAQEHELVPRSSSAGSRPRSSARSGCSSRASRSSRRRCTSTRPSGRLTPLRSKEEAHDYRYFPEPDLVPLLATEEMLAAARADAARELPAERAERFERELGLHAERGPAVRVPGRARRLLRAGAGRAGADGGVPGSSRSSSSNWIPQLVERIGSDADPASSNVTPESLAALAAMVKAKEVSRDAAREVLTLLVARGRRPARDRRARGPGGDHGRDDGARPEIVDRAIAADPDAAEQVRAGQHEGDRPAGRLRDARDQGPRRRWRDHAPDPRAPPAG